MNKVTLILTALMTLTLVIFLAPNVVAINSGKVLRNIALWLAILLGLAIIYQNFGPGSKAQMFELPEGLNMKHGSKGQLLLDTNPNAKPDTLPNAAPAPENKGPDKAL